MTYRLYDRLPLPAVVNLCRTYPDGMAAIVHEALPQNDTVRAWDWERPAEIARIMRQRPGVVRGERSA